MKVLIADDDREQLSLRGMLLRRNGIETIEVTDGVSAVRLAIAQQPECAIVDLRLPTEELGLRLIRELKAVNSAMHLFVLTGCNPRRWAEYPESRLVDELVVKGSSSAYLVEKLKALSRGANQ